MATNNPMRGWSTEYGVGMEDDLSVSLDGKPANLQPNRLGDPTPGKAGPLNPLGFQVSVPISHVGSSDADPAGSHVEGDAATVHSTSSCQTITTPGHSSSLNDDSNVKAALGKLWNLALDAGQPEKLPAVNAAFLPRRPGPLPIPLYKRFAAAVEMASVLLPTGWYKKHGDHDFTSSSKTPNLGFRKEGGGKGQQQPQGNPGASNAKPSSELTFEDFGREWYGIAKQYCAGDSKEDYYEFTGRMVLSVGEVRLDDGTKDGSLERGRH